MMGKFLAEYGTEGPLGFPMTDKHAIALESILKALPKDDGFKYRKAIVAKGASEVLPGERTDVSWISTEDPDRTREVVRSKGMNDSQYKGNPIVTLMHAYHLPPIGKSLWRKQFRDGPIHGIKAKTHYPPRPPAWPEGKDWPADIALALVQSDLLRGKSIGFLPTKIHEPSAKEFESQGWSGQVDLVIDEWILLEYACTFLPAQQNALVEAVGKSKLHLPKELFDVFGVDSKAAPTNEITTTPSVMLFTPLEEIEKAMQRHIQSLDLAGLANQTARAVLNRLTGKV